MSRGRTSWLPSLLGLALLLAGGLPARVRAAPVELLLSDSQAFLQDDGGMDVIYTLRFRELESRSAIRKVGQFYQPLVFTRAWIEGGGSRATASLTSLGGGYYRVEFPGLTTRRGQVYRLVLHLRLYRRFADPTSAGDQQLLAVWFNPVRWELPVEKSVIRLVLPLELPAGLEKPEDITPQMVDALGVQTNAANLAQQDQWAWVYTDYHGQRRRGCRT